MSLREDGIHYCDHCDTSVGNGSVVDAAIVSDLDPDIPGGIRVLHFCRQREVDGRMVKGCAGQITGPRMLRAYHTSKGHHHE